MNETSLRDMSLDKVREIDNILKFINDAWPKFVQYEIN